MHDVAFEIPELHEPELEARLHGLIDGKTKPLGALGRIEALAQQIGQVLGTEQPRLREPQLVVFAADHGLAAHGVSAYPSEVTWQMVGNFLSGGAAASVLARQHGIALTVVDCGVRREFDPQAGLVLARLGPGTFDALAGPAMTPQQCEAALANGARVVRSLPGNAMLLGEMGIGNTSSAALLLARLTGADIADCTGAGTGLQPEAVHRKTMILREVLARHAQAQQPLDALAALGGFEIATMVGAVLQSARERRVIVVDGFIAGAAVLVASRLAPAVLQRCVFAHRSDERGHARLLAALDAVPLLELGLRLGEGSGALLAWPLLVSACTVLRDMASFESAGVSRGESRARTR
jgi:nicotinate-nucleotide--dimethylbenzimidazole phosphoribosyltransferase